MGCSPYGFIILFEVYNRLRLFALWLMDLRVTPDTASVLPVVAPEPAWTYGSDLKCIPRQATMSMQSRG